ncbi:MAG: hypothetical protein R3F35_15345 [Myxococcota bacterium]
MATEDPLAVVGRPVPTGREARLWRVLVELAIQVDEAIAAHAEAMAAAEAAATTAVSPGPRRMRHKTRPMLPGRLENLVVEFDDAYTFFVEGMTSLPTEAQMLALQAIDRQLAAMIRAREAELWTERALREDARWSEAQRMAAAVIEAFAWPARRMALVGASRGGGVGRVGGREGDRWPA